MQGLNDFFRRRFWRWFFALCALAALLRAGKGYAPHYDTVRGHLGLPRANQPKSRILIQSGGVVRDGIGNTLNFLKDAMSMAHALGLELRVSESPTQVGQFQYKVTHLLQADTIDVIGRSRICDLHTIIVELPTGEFEERVVKSEGEVDAFRDRIRTHCEDSSEQLSQLEPHIKERIEACDVIIWADQRIRAYVGWNMCDRISLRKLLQSPGTRRNKSVGLHYRYGDLPVTSDGKWLYDKEDIERILSSIHSCDPTWMISVYMKASFPQESVEHRKAVLSPIRTFDDMVDTGQDLKDLVMLSTHDILIVNSGAYSEAAVAASTARIVIFNGHFPGVFWYLKKTQTKVYTTQEAARLDWCRILQELS